MDILGRRTLLRWVNRLSNVTATLHEDKSELSIASIKFSLWKGFWHDMSYATRHKAVIFHAREPDAEAFIYI